MKLTQQEYNELIRKHPNLVSKGTIQTNCNSHQRLRPRTITQEPKDDMQEAVDNSSKVQGKNGRDHPKYRVTITWLVSDKRRRDNDGMLATALDSLVSASRRLAGLDAASGSKRRVRK